MSGNFTLFLMPAKPVRSALSGVCASSLWFKGFQDIAVHSALTNASGTARVSWLGHTPLHDNHDNR